MSEYTPFFTKNDALNNAMKLYHIALCHQLSLPKPSRKSMLFMYLLGNRFVSRIQLHNLLSYDIDSGRNLSEYIGKFVRTDLLKKYSTDGKNALMDVYTLTRSGYDVGRESFVSEIENIISEKNVFYAEYVLKLLMNDLKNLNEFTQLLIDNSVKGYNAYSLRHLLATRDSYIIYLRYLLPGAFFYSRTEVEFDGYEPAVDVNRSLFARTGVRSDAVHLLPLRRTDFSTSVGNDCMICIEQDTLRQTSTVLMDKVNRYINLIALPRYREKGVPMILCFSIFPPSHRSSSNGSERERKSKMNVVSGRQLDARYVDVFSCFASLYAEMNHVSPDAMTLEEFAVEFGKIAMSSGNESFDKYIDYLGSHIEELGRELPVSKLKERCKELSSVNESAMNIFSKAHSSYVNRRSTIFEMAAGIQGIELMANMGFSIATVCNYELHTLLSFFPAHCSSTISLTSFCNVFIGEEPEYVPMYHHRCQSGTEIVFRNAFRCNGTIYVVENVAEDFCAGLRLKSLMMNDPELSICCIIVSPRPDLTESVQKLQTIVPPSKRGKIFIASYYAGADGNIAYSSPTSLTTF